MINFCVSLTTLPSRIENIKRTIESIDSQTLKANGVFLSELNAKSRKKLIDNCVNYSKKYYIKNIIGKWVKLLKVSPNVKF